MELILFTSSDKFRSEIYIILKMFENGLENLHIKKPGFSKKQLKNYIELIPEKHHNKIIIHSHYNLILKYNLKGIHLSSLFKDSSLFYKKYVSLLKLLKPKLFLTCSYHNLNQLLNHHHTYNYVFLSPVFNKDGSLNSKFTEDSIKSTISQINIKVFALGGVNETNLKKIKSMNFNGLALKGSIWHGIEQPFDLYLINKKHFNTL